MTTTFAVPCAVCSAPESEIQHGRLNILASNPHDYVPDEHSAEWAAVKLREALQALLAQHDGPMAPVGKLWHACEGARNALALADAAGIGGSDDK
jgi:hypothetical protein